MQGKVNARGGKKNEKEESFSLGLEGSNPLGTRAGRSLKKGRICRLQNFRKDQTSMEREEYRKRFEREAKKRLWNKKKLPREREGHTNGGGKRRILTVGTA